jgi:hypothetical protein
MAKKPTKSPSSRPASRGKPADTAKPRSKAGKSKSKPRPKSRMSASDAFSGLLESPLAAEVIAAGAAAALATLTQQAISKKAQGGTRDALKLAAKAAAVAMGARLATEIDEIVRARKPGSEAK